MSNFPDMVTQFGGVPTGSPFGWKSGSKTWFVDGDAAATGDGRSINRPFKTIAEAIAAASAWDVIYIAPLTYTTLAYSYPGLNTAYAESTSIAYAKAGLAVVGIAHQGFRGVPHGVVIRETASATTANMSVYAPLCAFENLAFERGGTETGGQLTFQGGTTLTYEGNGGTVYNCYFFMGNGTTAISPGYAGAISAGQVWGLTVDNCHFLGCRIGIQFNSGTATAGSFVAKNLTFASRNAAATDIDADIVSYTLGSTNILIDNITCAHLIPSLSGGSFLRYISLTADVRQGIISRVRTGNVQAGTLTCGSAGTGIICPDNVGVCECYNGKNLLMVEST